MKKTSSNYCSHLQTKNNSLPQDENPRVAISTPRTLYQIFYSIDFFIRLARFAPPAHTRTLGCEDTLVHTHTLGCEDTLVRTKTLPPSPRAIRTLASRYVVRIHACDPVGMFSGNGTFMLGKPFSASPRLFSAPDAAPRKGSWVYKNEKPATDEKKKFFFFWRKGWRDGRDGRDEFSRESDFRARVTKKPG